MSIDNDNDMYQDIKKDNRLRGKKVNVYAFEYNLMVTLLVSSIFTAILLLGPHVQEAYGDVTEKILTALNHANL